MEYAANMTVTLPAGGPGMGQTFTIVNNASPFGSHSPKPDSINAVKLTKENMKGVAAHVIGALGDVEVEVKDDRLSVRDGVFKGYYYPHFSAKVGDWVVEEYHYRSEKPKFRVARSDERWKYDLR